MSQTKNPVKLRKEKSGVQINKATIRATKKPENVHLYLGMKAMKRNTQ